MIFFFLRLLARVGNSNISPINKIYCNILYVSYFSFHIEVWKAFADMTLRFKPVGETLQNPASF